MCPLFGRIFFISKTYKIAKDYLLHNFKSYTESMFLFIPISS